MSLRRASFFIALFLLLGFTNCATYKQRRIDIHPADEYPHLSAAHEGIVVAADPYHSTEKAKQGFYVDVTRKGFLPVNMIVMNDTNEEVRVSKESIELIDENGLSYEPVDAKVMFDNHKENPLARFVAGSVISVSIGTVSAVSAIIANRKMRADWREKEMPDELIIESGKQMNGFVYFRVPRDTTTTVSKLCLESERLDSLETVEFELAPTENLADVTISPVSPSDIKANRFFAETLDQSNSR